MGEERREVERDPEGTRCRIALLEQGARALHELGAAERDDGAGLGTTSRSRVTGPLVHARDLQDLDGEPVV